MRKKIFHNWGLKLISLVLATLLWILVVQMGDPQDAKDMGNVQVKLINTDLLEKENKVYEILDHSDMVRVTVRAPRSVFERLRNSDIVAEADVSRLTDINTVPINFSTTIANVVSIKGNHESVKLNVEDRVSKYVNLITTTVGEVAEGYMVASVTPDQNRIEVTGPRSAVEQVKYAGVVIDVSDATSNLSVNVDIDLYDADDDPVEHEHLVKNVDYVRMSAEVLAVKEVPIEVNFTGTPADGYIATGVVDYDRESMLIAGTTYALSRINSIVIPEEKLDITGASENFTTAIDLREYLPDNIRLAESDFNGKMDVTVYVEAIAERTLSIPAQNVTLSNVPEEVAAVIVVPSEGNYSLTVSGLREQVNAIRQESVTGTVDVSRWVRDERKSELKSGTYSMPVRFDLNNKVTAVSTVRVEVTVREIGKE